MRSFIGKRQNAGRACGLAWHDTITPSSCPDARREFSPDTRLAHLPRLQGTASKDGILPSRCSHRLLVIARAGVFHRFHDFLFVTLISPESRVSRLLSIGSLAAKVEFHFGELFPRVGFIVMNLSLPSRAVVRFYK